MALPKIARAHRPVREVLALIGACSLSTAGFFAATFARTATERVIAVAGLSVAAVQMILILHDAMHESLFRSHQANRWVGRLIGAFYLTPFHFLQWSHLQHHQHAGRIEGDTELLHPPRVHAQRKRFGAFLATLARSPLAPVCYAPLLQLSHLIALPEMRQTRRSRLLRDSAVDLSWMAVAWVPLAVALHAYGALGTALVFGFMCPFAISLSLVYCAASPLHTGMVASSVADRPVTERAFFVSRSIDSSWLGRFIFCNLGFHIEHHLYAHLPRWQLGEAARALRPALLAYAAERNLPVIIHPGYVRYYAESLARVTRFNELTPDRVAFANAGFTLVHQ